MGEDRNQAIRTYFLENSGRAELGDANPLFAGRDEVLNAILRSAERLSRSAGPMANLSTVVYGAPGSGKSELLAQLRERLNALKTDSPVAVVSGGAELLTEAAAFGGAVYEQLGHETKGRLRDKFRWDVGTLTLGPIGISAHRENGAPPISQSARIRKVALDLDSGAHRPVIVLLIDEAQARLREARSNPDNFVLDFHMGEVPLKVLPVYAGLGNTPGALSECDVSRLGDDMRHPMSRLSDPDLAAMAGDALNALTGQAPDTIRRWSDEIVNHAQGWPMHLSHVLKAVAGKSAPNWSLDDRGFRDAMTGAERKRTLYYSDRLYACPELKPSFYAAWASLLKDGRPVDESDIARSLNVSDQAAETLARRAVGAGLLEPGPYGYVSPIPSLLDHIEDRAVRSVRPGIGTGR